MALSFCFALTGTEAAFSLLLFPRYSDAMFVHPCGCRSLICCSFSLPGSVMACISVHLNSELLHSVSCGMLCLPAVLSPVSMVLCKHRQRGAFSCQQSHQKGVYELFCVVCTSRKAEKTMAL